MRIERDNERMLGIERERIREYGIHIERKHAAAFFFVLSKL